MVGFSENLLSVISWSFSSFSATTSENVLFLFFTSSISGSCGSSFRDEFLIEDTRCSNLSYLGSALLGCDEILEVFRFGEEGNDIFLSSNSS